MPVQTSSPARAARKSTTKKSPSADPKLASKLSSKLTPEERRALIAEAAYLRAERRGFTPGHEVEDWVAAEAEIALALTACTKAPQ